MSSIWGVTDIAPGVVVGEKYCIERLLGEGTFGVVYVALDEASEARVALKLLKIDHATDATLLGRFAREARVASRIDNEHVARVLDHGISGKNGSPYIAFELLEGEDLSRILLDSGPLSTELAVDYVMEALVGVAAAHVEGIAHRDLKPANLFRAKRNGAPPIVKVLDFGIAKALKGREAWRGPATSTGSLIGSPSYAAPEQLRSSRRIDARADIWSIGVTLYELLTGVLPFRGEGLARLLESILQDPPTPPTQYRPDLPRPLVDVLVRCLQRERDRRYGSVQELGAALAPFGSAVSQAARAKIDVVFSEATEPRASFWDSGSARRTPLPAHVRDRAASPTRRRAGGPWRGNGRLLAALGVLLVLVSATISFLLVGR